MRKQEKNEENARKQEKVNCKLIFLKKVIDKQISVWYYSQADVMRNYALQYIKYFLEVLIMSTFMAKPAEIQRKWYIIDAANRPLGRTAARVADLLRGKLKPEFTPHVDCGDHVVVINADKAVLTGNKLQKKFYRRHTGYIGGLKEVKYATLMNTRPELAMELAVKGMVPDTTIGRKALTRLHVYSGTEYAQVAQKPEKYEF